MSSYVRETLADGEDIIMVAHFNWTYWVPAIFWCVFGLSPLAYAGVLSVEGRLPGDPLWIYGAGAVPAVLGALGLVGHWVHVVTTEIAVTTGRFVYKTGLISRKTKEVSLNKIEEINLSQSVLGRLFGFGKLILRGTGVGVIRLPNIDDPVHFRRAIEGSRSRLRNGDDNDSDAAAKPVEEAPVAAPAEGFAVTSASAAPVRSKPAKKQKPSRKRRGRKASSPPDLPEKLR